MGRVSVILPGGSLEEHPSIKHVRVQSVILHSLNLIRVSPSAWIGSIQVSFR